MYIHDIVAVGLNLLSTPQCVGISTQNQWPVSPPVSKSPTAQWMKKQQVNNLCRFNSDIPWLYWLCYHDLLSSCTNKLHSSQQVHLDNQKVLENPNVRLEDYGQVKTVSISPKPLCNIYIIFKPNTTKKQKKITSFQLNFCGFSHQTRLPKGETSFTVETEN